MGEIGGHDPAELIPIEEVERRYILHVLNAVGGNKTSAARILGLDRDQEAVVGRLVDPLASGKLQLCLNQLVALPGQVHFNMFRHYFSIDSHWFPLAIS